MLGQRNNGHPISSCKTRACALHFVKKQPSTYSLAFVVVRRSCRNLKRRRMRRRCWAVMDRFKDDIDLTGVGADRWEGYMRNMRNATTCVKKHSKTSNHNDVFKPGRQAIVFHTKAFEVNFQQDVYICVDHVRTGQAMCRPMSSDNGKLYILM